MAASALVALPGPAGSRSPSQTRPIDQAALAAVTIPVDPASGAITTLDPADRSAGWLGPDSQLAEPGLSGANWVKPNVTQPVLTAARYVKNYWRFDPNISWYGSDFYGKRTACGLKYTKTLLGVAHRTLPCGTLVTFEYNGVTVTAPVIDRGPYVNGREWDMSVALCKALDHCYTGVITWRWGVWPSP
jgi:rare lipoprotein A (peptidoglycan hydrolase)